MATTSEVKTYRDDLLAAGVAVELSSPEASAVRKVAAEGFGTAIVRGRNVADMLACGLFKSGKKNILLLPPDGEDLAAAVDFLRYEVMNEQLAKAQAVRGAANGITTVGADLGLIEPIKFRPGHVTAVMTNGKKKKHAAELIGDWGIYPEGRRFNVTHRWIGAKAASFSKKAKAREFAKAMAESPYPWRMILGIHDTRTAAWESGTKFAVGKIEEFSGAKRTTDAREANPRQLELFPRR